MLSAVLVLPLLLHLMGAAGTGKAATLADPDRRVQISEQCHDGVLIS